MNDFDRELAKCIGLAASKSGDVNRTLISSCYYKTLVSSAKTESSQVSEKWVDFLANRLNGLNLTGRNAEQVAKVIFERIAKT
jgi:hypothetical protein